jgi:acetyl esterase/lipase
MSEFHPDLRLIARLLPRGVGRSWLVKLMRLVPVPATRLPPGIEVVERDGVRIIAPPKSATPRPVILYIHGGGYVIGSAKQDDALCAQFAAALGATVVSVDYRLAPEHPFPQPLEDCFAAYELVHREAASLGVDPSRLVIAGQSAGGGLAAALTLLVHDRGRPPPKLQLLIYPMLDDRSVRPELDRPYFRAWDVKSNQLGWKSYLGGAEATEHAAPARRSDLRGLPPAWIGVGTLDLFHDEDVAYAARLREAGVPVTLEIVEGAFHGFDAIARKAGVSQRFIAAQIAAMQKALEG